MIRCTINIRENCPRKCFSTKEKETRVKFNPGLGANGPSFNWAQHFSGVSTSENYKLFF